MLSLKLPLVQSPQHSNQYKQNLSIRNQPSSELEARMISSDNALSVDADIEVFETAAVKPVKPWDGPPSRGDMP